MAADISYALLGTPVGSLSFANSFFIEQLNTIFQLTALNSQIIDLQTRVKLFTSCLLQKLLHLLSSDIMHQLPRNFDPKKWPTYSGALGLGMHKLIDKSLQHLLQNPNILDQSKCISHVHTNTNKGGLSPLFPLNQVGPDYVITSMTSAIKQAQLGFITNLDITPTKLHPSIHPSIHPSPTYLTPPSARPTHHACKEGNTFSSLPLPTLRVQKNAPITNKPNTFKPNFQWLLIWPWSTPHQPQRLFLFLPLFHNRCQHHHCPQQVLSSNQINCRFSTKFEGCRGHWSAGIWEKEVHVRQEYSWRPHHQHTLNHTRINHHKRPPWWKHNSNSDHHRPAPRTDTGEPSPNPSSLHPKHPSHHSYSHAAAPMHNAVRKNTKMRYFYRFS